MFVNVNCLNSIAKKIDFQTFKQFLKQSKQYSFHFIDNYNNSNLFSLFEIDSLICFEVDLYKNTQLLFEIWSRHKKSNRHRISIKSLRILIFDLNFIEI
jgi:hypothetical protein